MVEGAGYPAGESLTRCKAVCKDGHQPDAILVLMGINDWGWGGVWNQILGRGSATPTCYDVSLYPFVAPGPAAPHANFLFEAAYVRMLTNLHAVAPAATLYCLTMPVPRLAGEAHSTFAYHLRNVEFDAYNNAIRSAASMCATSCNARLLDVRAFNLDYQSIDGTHPTAQGMEQIAALVAAAMRGDTTLAPDETALFEAHAASGTRCCEHTCLGCPYLRQQDFGWNNICELDLPGSRSTVGRGGPTGAGNALQAKVE
jgi:lysophospholipase L1-like esterase